MTPTPKQDLLNLIPPYWAIFLLLSCVWVGLTEMPDSQAFMVFACYSAGLLGIVGILEHAIVQERTHIAAMLYTCCDSLRAAALFARFRELHIIQVLLVIFACGLSRIVAWGVA
jgi:hypothetical protein